MRFPAPFAPRTQILVVAAMLLSGIASAALTRGDAEDILRQAFPTPTPMEAPAEVTADGNVAVSGRAVVVVVVGEAPVTVLPQRCRADAASFPAGTTFLCYRDDMRARWMHGELP